ncbi:nickel pincer cofactor biosynthesis protein LarB [bacterium]|nr:nickel pincer cofactor biosynthesis protein LarB [bacterium]
MNTELLEQLLEMVKDGRLEVGAAMQRLRSLPYEDIGFAKLDNHRSLRSGFPEVVYCQGKTNEQVIEIMKHLCKGNKCILGTRASTEVYDAVKNHIPNAAYNKPARIITVGKPVRSDKELAQDDKYVMVVCGGTADIPVAEEAAVTARVLGSRVEKSYDVGVAGLHRLLDQKETLLGANVIIAVAGMEGALASVVGGMVSRPVIAVPTSIGYGASFGGLAALLSMLNSCAVGVSVVNIDNGFGAGYLAHMINKGQ